MRAEDDGVNEKVPSPRALEIAEDVVAGFWWDSEASRPDVEEMIARAIDRAVAEERKAERERRQADRLFPLGGALL